MSGLTRLHRCVRFRDEAHGSLALQPRCAYARWRDMNPIRSFLRRLADFAASAITLAGDGARSSPTPAEQGTLRTRIAILLGVLAFPAMAASGDFGAMPGDAPIESERVSRKMATMPAMPFERPGMTFPGSAFFYLADPLEKGLIALPTTDPLDSGADNGREVGQLVDAGPAARPFFSSASGASHSRSLECLGQAIWYEAASEGEAGQRAVAQVVLNRVAHPSWPDSVCGVVYQGSQRSTGCQFSFTCDGSLSRRASGASWRRAQAIASDALSGSVYSPIGHATHYHTLWVNPAWAHSLEPIGTIGAHLFYRNRGATGERAAFTAAYIGTEPGVTGRTQPATPVAMPRIEYATAKPHEAPAQRAPAASAAPASGQRPSSGIGTAGQVKQEYAQAGQWKHRPERARETFPPVPPDARTPR